MLNSACSRIAWMQWNHPNMPWDENYLYCAGLTKQEDEVVLIMAEKIVAQSQLNQAISLPTAVCR